METQMEQNVQLISEMIKNVANDIVPMICILSLLVSKRHLDPMTSHKSPQLDTFLNTTPRPHKSVAIFCHLGANVIKLLQKFFIVNYCGKKTLLFQGLKYHGNLLSYCSNVLSSQGKFDVINIPMII